MGTQLSITVRQVSKYNKEDNVSDVYNYEGDIVTIKNVNLQNSGGTVNGQYIAIMDSYIDGGKIIAGYDYGKDTYNNETYSKYSAINIVNSHIAEGTTVAAVGKLTGESTSNTKWKTED